MQRVRSIQHCWCIGVHSKPSSKRFSESLFPDGDPIIETCLVDLALHPRKRAAKATHEKRPSAAKRGIAQDAKAALGVLVFAAATFS